MKKSCVRGKMDFSGGYMCQGGKVGLPAGAYKRRNTVSYDFCAIPD